MQESRSNRRPCTDWSLGAIALGSRSHAIRTSQPLRHEMEQLEDEMDQLESQLEGAVKQLEGEMDQLESEKDQLESEKEQLEREMATLHIANFFVVSGEKRGEDMCSSSRYCCMPTP